MKNYLTSSIAVIGLLSGSLLLYGQSAGGGGAGGGAVGGGAGGSSGSVGGGAASGGAVGGAGGVAAGGAGASAGTGVAAGGVATPGRAGVAPGGAVTPSGQAGQVGTPSAIGAGNNPATAPAAPVSNLPNNPAVVDTTGSQLNNRVTTPAQAVPYGALPATVQNTLRRAAGTGNFGTISQQMTANGPVYTVSVVRNGVPVEMQIGANGQVLAQGTANSPGLTTNPSTPGTGSGTTVNPGAPGVAAANNPAVTSPALSSAQAGIPLTSLPGQLQTSIQSQLGNAQIQTISRDDLANGSVFRVTALRNGVPTEFQFGANGTLISSAPLPNTATSAFVPSVVGTLPGNAVVLDTLPPAVQTAIRAQAANGRINAITQQQTPNGLSYFVSYDQNGRPMTMVLGPDGTVRTNTVGSIGAPAPGATGTGGTTNAPANRNPAQRRPISMDELPFEVEASLRQEAPNAEIRFIEKESQPTGEVYRIGMRADDRYTEVVIGADGNVIRDSRDVEVLAIGSRLEKEAAGSMALSEVPVAIQNAIRAYARENRVRTISLNLADGKTVYDVIFYRDGRRDRMVIAKDGTLLKMQENVAPAYEIALAPEQSPKLAIGDLPQEVQDTIRRQTDQVVVDSLSTKVVGDQTVYSVKYATNGAPVELLVGTDGAIILPEGGPANANTPLQAGVDRADDQAQVVKVVDVAAENGDEISISDPATENVGTGATVASEAGQGGSRASEPRQEVALSDVPPAVQKTAKRVAGSGVIEAINPRIQIEGVVYEIEYSKDGQSSSVIVNGAGEVQEEIEASQP